MIRKCKEGDAEKLLEYLYKNKEFNLFLIGDIENFGIENDNLEIYIDIDNKIHSVYLRYYNNLCLVSYENKLDLNFINKTFIETGLVSNMSLEKTLADIYNFQSFNQRDFYFAALNKVSIFMDTPDVIQIKADEVESYLKETELVFKTKGNLESTKAELNANSKHIFAIKKNNRLISGASTSAESKELAMIIGVYTLEEFRRKGLAQQCVFALCDKMTREGKTVCLFYDNPNAAKLYKKIGFKDIGMFSKLSLKE